MPIVSVIIPTCNRPGLLEKAILSVLNQTYTDLEVIVVDDGLLERAQNVISKISDPRLKYLPHEITKGGAAARNTGIRQAQGDFIAFLDDDDEWLPEKLSVQMKEFATTSPEVGFCFCSVVAVKSDQQRENTQVPTGIQNYHEQILSSFNGFLTVTLIIKKEVFEKIGYFDEAFPSHQEPDLMIRVSKQYKGLGINQPLVLLNVRQGHEHIGSNLNKKVQGRKMILEKYLSDFKTRPRILAKHYFQLGLMLRDNRQIQQARHYFLLAWLTDLAKVRFLGHYIVNLIKK